VGQNDYGVPDPAIRYPRCIAGKRACPPEDCGGPYGYAELPQTIKDPSHPEHEDMLEWPRDDFDPEAFDPAEVNRAMLLVRQAWCGDCTAYANLAIVHL